MQFFGDPTKRTQITQKASAEDATVVLYTVPADKKFYLISVMMRITTGAAGVSKVAMRTVGDVDIMTLAGVGIASALGSLPSDHFSPDWPIELTAGQDIAVSTNASGLAAEANLFGYEVNA